MATTRTKNRRAFRSEPQINAPFDLGLNVLGNYIIVDANHTTVAVLFPLFNRRNEIEELRPLAETIAALLNANFDRRREEAD